MKIKVFITAAFLFLLCGCNYIEPEAQYIVTALGFTEQSGNALIYLQAVDTAQGDSSNPDTFLIKGEGEDTAAALDNVKAGMSKKPSFEHCRVVLISEDVLGEKLNETLRLCDGLDLSLRARMVYSDDIEGVLDGGQFFSGTQIDSLIKQNADSFGYGAHTALFEICTAILTNDGNFALPVLKVQDRYPSVEGLKKYVGMMPGEYLDIKESIRYAKENNVYEGEK